MSHGSSHHNKLFLFNSHSGEKVDLFYEQNYGIIAMPAFILDFDKLRFFADDFCRSVLCVKSHVMTLCDDA